MSSRFFAIELAFHRRHVDDIRVVPISVVIIIAIRELLALVVAGMLTITVARWDEQGFEP